jgi:hypothetical protein
VQTRPSGHAEHQYDGLFKGLGTTSKDPSCSKRNSQTKKIHDMTHFAIGCKKWDQGDNRGYSQSHQDFPDYKVVYATCDVPDKNTSVVELRMQHFQPDVHYRTEQRELFEDPGPQPRDLSFAPDGATHTNALGNDPRDYSTSAASVHDHKADESRRVASSLRSAGQGALVSNSLLPKPERGHVLHGGPRNVDMYTLGVENGNRHNRYTGNHTNIVWEPNSRDPILGHHVLHDSLVVPGAKTTAALISEANTTLPKLRSLSSLRPH